MTSKPTYEELEQRIQILEEELGDNKNHHYLEAVLNNTNMPVYLKNAEFKYIFMNRQLGRLAHVDHEQVKGKDDFDLFPEPTAQLFRSQDEEVIESRALVEFEETILLPDGVQTFMTAKFPLFDSEGQVSAIGGACTDITVRKRIEAELKEAHDELEQRVADRTAQLDRRTERLMETNIALKILLEKREADKKELEERVMFNVDKLISPYLKKLKAKCNDDSQKSLLQIVQANLDEITSPFANNHKNSLANLTPAQIQIANLIKQGQTTKEIASLLNLSPTTVAGHRQEIRKRLSLTNKKINLRTTLVTTP